MSGLQVFLEISKKLNYFIPESVDLNTFLPEAHRKNYPLRPELIESIYYCYQASSQSKLLDHAMRMVDALELGCKTHCGYAALSNVLTLEKEDKMDSFFLAETLKYFYLLFSFPTAKYQGILFNFCKRQENLFLLIAFECPVQVVDGNDLSDELSVCYFLLFL